MVGRVSSASLESSFEKAKLLHMTDRKTEAVLHLWDLTRTQLPRGQTSSVVAHFASKVFLKLATW